MAPTFYWIISTIDAVVDGVTDEWPLLFIFISLMTCSTYVDVRRTEKFPFYRLSLISDGDEDDYLRLPTVSPKPSSPSGVAPENSARAFPFRRSSAPIQSSSWVPGLFSSWRGSSSPERGSSSAPLFMDQFACAAEADKVSNWSFPIRPPRRPKKRSPPPASHLALTFSPTWSTYPGEYPKQEGDLMRRSKSFPTGERDKAWLLGCDGFPPQSSPPCIGMRGRRRSKKYEIRKILYTLTTVEEDLMREESEASSGT